MDPSEDQEMRRRPPYDRAVYAVQTVMRDRGISLDQATALLHTLYGATVEWSDLTTDQLHTLAQRLEAAHAPRQ